MVRELIRTMSRTNPLWGAPRIHGELLKLDIHVSQATVSKYVIRTRKPPSQSWRTFLSNHLPDLVSIDFFTVPTATFRVLYVFIVLSHDRRSVLHFNVTDHPTAQWTAQQVIEAFPFETAPRYLLRDRDGIYGNEFQRRVARMGIERVCTAPRSPWQNPYVERLIGSVRQECLEPSDYLRMKLTFIVSYEITWPTTIRSAPIFPSIRMLQKEEGKSHQKLGRSAPFLWSEDYITAIRDERHEHEMYICR